MTTSGGTWNEVLWTYATAQRAAGRAAGTISLHRHYLLRLARAHRDWWRVQLEHLEAFVGQPGWKPETRKSARAAVRAFYRWAHRRGLIPADPAAELPPVRIPPAKPRPTPEHLVRDVVLDIDDRLRLMARLAAFYGLRRGEICKVHRRDLAGDVLHVIGKGGRMRSVPILDDWTLEQLGRAEAWLFPGPSGHLSAGHVGKLLSAALPEGWTAHTLRHRCASTSYAVTRDLVAVMELLGHTRLETTQRYVATPDDAVRALVRATALVGGTLAA